MKKIWNIVKSVWDAATTPNLLQTYFFLILLTQVKATPWEYLVGIIFTWMFYMLTEIRDMFKYGKFKITLEE